VVHVFKSRDKFAIGLFIKMVLSNTFMTSISDIRTASDPAVRSGDLLCCVEKQLYPIAAELGSLRDKLAAANEPRCAWEIEQTLRALAEAVRTIQRAKLNEPLPSVEDIQKIYRDAAGQETKQHNAIGKSHEIHR
jgi:hypothetical protein